MLVKDCMSTPVITVHPDTTMPEALELMQREHIRRLAVINKAGKLVGIVSERSMLRAMPSEATTLSVYEIRELTRKIKVEQIMATKVVTVEENTPIEEAARVMADGKFSGLPILRGGKLVGMVTETDIFKTFIDLLGGRQSGVRMSVLTPQQPGQIAKLTRVIYELGGDIISLSTSAGDSAETGLITFKVDGVDKQTLVDAITPQVLAVVDARDTHF